MFSALVVWNSLHRRLDPLCYIISKTYNVDKKYVHSWVHSVCSVSVTYYCLSVCQFSSVQLLSRVQLFETPWTAACEASLSITNSQSSLKLMSIESVMPSSHLILCHPRLLLPSIFARIRVFSSESVLWIKWPKYWSFSFSISPSKEYSGLISLRMDSVCCTWNISLSRVIVLQ